MELDGRDVRGPQTDVGIVFQSDVLLDWRTNLDNVLLQIEMRKLPVGSTVSEPPTCCDHRGRATAPDPIPPHGARRGAPAPAPEE